MKKGKYCIAFINIRNIFKIKQYVLSRIVMQFTVSRFSVDLLIRLREKHIGPDELGSKLRERKKKLYSVF
jgi:hypothetical protein